MKERHPAEHTLRHLERCEPINAKWRAYILARSVEVEGWISALFAFAALNPESSAGRAVTERAGHLRRRLDAVLARAKGGA